MPIADPNRLNRMMDCCAHLHIAAASQLLLKLPDL
jgi:hypothetical protein